MLFLSVFSRMNKFYITYTIFIFTFLLMMVAQNSYSQSRSSLGIRFGINKPYADAYKFGTGAALQVNIAFNSKWGLEPSLGYDRINGNRETLYLSDGPHTFIDAESLNLIHIDLAARYYIIPSFFANLGPVLYFAGGNEDLISGGIGATAAVGYQLMLDNHNNLEFLFNTDLINARNGRGNGITPIAGLKVAYSFNFRRL
jgi:hypothetical protein